MGSKQPSVIVVVDSGICGFRNKCFCCVFMKAFLFCESRIIPDWGGRDCRFSFHTRWWWQIDVLFDTLFLVAKTKLFRRDLSIRHGRRPQSATAVPQTICACPCPVALIVVHRCANTYYPLEGNQGSRLLDMVVSDSDSEGEGAGENGDPGNLVGLFNHDEEKLRASPSEGRWAVTLNEVRAQPKASTCIDNGCIE